MTSLARTIVCAQSLVLLMSVVATTLHAQSLGELQVTPTRVVFDGPRRFEVLTLTNRGIDTATYQISIVQYRMTRAGRLESIETPDSGQYFATDLLRFYPRSVVIPPGETQNIRVQLRIPSTLPAGEYRSHFAFNKVTASAPESDSTSAAADEFSVRVSALYGVSIPVIVRNGELAADISLRNIAILPATDSAGRNPVVTCTLGRSGHRSVFGNMHVLLGRPDGSRIRIGGANGIAVYTPVAERDVRIPLQLPDGLSLAEGTIEVEYRNRSEEGDGTIARSELRLP